MKGLNMIYSFKPTRKKRITSLLVAILILTAGFTAACGILPDSLGEEDIDRGKMNELYKLKGTYIGDNSNVRNIINLLAFNEELIYDGIELFTDEEPYGLQVNFKGDPDKKEEYINNSRDYVFRPQSLILFALIDNLEYIQYAIDSDEGTRSAFYINREMADSLTMSTLGYRVAEVVKSEKLFEEFYNIYGDEGSIIRNKEQGSFCNFMWLTNTFHRNTFFSLFY